MRPKGVADAQQVDIPVPPENRVGNNASKQGHRRIVEPDAWKSLAKYGGL